MTQLPDVPLELVELGVGVFHLDGHILIVWTGADPLLKTPHCPYREGAGDGLSVELNAIVSRLLVAHLANLEPELERERPMHPIT